MVRQKSFFFFLLFALLLLPLFFSAASPAAPPLKVGVLQPLTGKYSEAGQAQKAGAEFVAEEINAAGGIQALGGARIQLVVADTTSEPAPISGEMERLCAVEKVSVVHGPYASTESNSSAPVGERYGIPNLSIQSTGDSLYPLKLKFWRTISMATSDVGRFHVSTLQKLIQEFKILNNMVASLMFFVVAKPEVPTQILTFLYTRPGAGTFTMVDVFFSTSTIVVTSPALTFPVMFTYIIGSALLKK